MKDKTSNVPATLDNLFARYAPFWKITKHKSTGGGGGGTQAFSFDRHAHPTTNFHCPKKENDSEFKPKKQNKSRCNVCQSLNKYEKLL